MVKNAKKRQIAEVEMIFTRLHEVFDCPDAAKSDIVDVLGDYLRDFKHIEKGKGLDARM